MSIYYSVHLLVSGLLSDPMPGASTGENVHKNIPSSLQGELPCDIFYINEQTDSLQAFQVSDLVLNQTYLFGVNVSLFFVHQYNFMVHDLSNSALLFYIRIKTHGIIQYF